MKTKQVTHTFTSFIQLPQVLLAAGLLIAGSFSAQSIVYDNFEGSKAVRYTEKGGVLDSAAKNPAPGGVNSSPKCGLYVRNASKKFDNFKMGLSSNLTEVDKYATYLGIPPKFKMKVYTTAPAGTLVEILLGSKRGNNDYPAGTHSQYQAYTKVSNQWEELEFLFSQIPQGSETSASQIDQIVILFNPNSSTSDNYYFDDITGPPLGGASTSTANVGDSQGEQQNAQPNDQTAPTKDTGKKKPKKAKK